MAVNEQTIQGDWNKIKGKIRERWGQLSGDELEETHGDVDQLVGTIQRRTGEARESIEKYVNDLVKGGASLGAKAVESAREYAESAKESVQGAARYASDAVMAGYARTEETVKRHPLESLAVCFGTGLITGVVVGLLIRRR